MCDNLMNLNDNAHLNESSKSRMRNIVNLRAKSRSGNGNTWIIVIDNDKN